LHLSQPAAVAAARYAGWRIPIDDRRRNDRSVVLQCRRAADRADGSTVTRLDQTPQATLRESSRLQAVGLRHVTNTLSGGCTYWYGDYDRQANARLHTRAFTALTTSMASFGFPTEHVAAAFAY
jgi:hypothetical protein